MKHIITILVCVLASVSAYATPDLAGSEGHPRLLVSSGDDFAKISEVVAGSDMLKTMEAYIFKLADETLSKSTNQRKMKGKRLLNVSADCFTRVFYLSYAYRVTGKYIYADRAIREMLAISSFTDWNPSHFLDVAEMMFAMSIGYDWLYHVMSDNQRDIIRNAIIEKGLEPSLNMTFCKHWLNSSSNWNQVCNAGSVFAALAVIETNPEYAEKIVPRAVETVKKPMRQYRPHGAYREGPGYWCYGTAYNCLLLAALEKYYGTDC